jgi:cytoskeletal protein CcmA (bactofilin family)
MFRRREEEGHSAYESPSHRVASDEGLPPRYFESVDRAVLSPMRSPHPISREELRKIATEEEESDELWGRSETQDLRRGGKVESHEPETTIGEGVVVKGEIQFRRFLRIDGHFEGETLAGEGKLVIGPRGLVRSNISLSEVIVEGRVEGSITAERIELRGEARVYGPIQARLLSVDEGAAISGQVEISPAEG